MQPVFTWVIVEMFEDIRESRMEQLGFRRPIPHALLKFLWEGTDFSRFHYAGRTVAVGMWLLFAEAIPAEEFVSQVFPNVFQG